MTVGRFLDQAATHLQTAQTLVRVQDAPAEYDIVSTVIARGQVYRELGRFLSIVHSGRRSAPVEGPTAVVGADPRGSLRFLAAALTEAVRGQENVHPGLLTARENAAAWLSRATDDIGLAAEVLCTHFEPPGVLRRNGSRFRTREAKALASGAERQAIVGEVARLTLATMQVDRALLAWRLRSQTTPQPRQWDLIEWWTASGYPVALQTLAGAQPAELTRGLDLVPVLERSTGPRTVRSWDDAVESVAAARATVRRDPSQATVGLVAVTARLGFTTCVVSVRRRHPGIEVESSRLARANAGRWRELATSLDNVADIAPDPKPIVAELDTAAAWLRGRTDPYITAHKRDRLAAVQLQQQVQALCRELILPLRIAIADGRLLATTKVIDPKSTRGVHLAVPVWRRATSDDGPVAAFLKRLQVVPDLPLTEQIGPAQIAATSFATAPAVVPADPILTPKATPTATASRHQ